MRISQTVEIELRTMMVLVGHSRRRRLQLLRLLQNLLERESVERPTIPSARIDLSSMADIDASIDFRFTVSQLELIITSLKMPDILITDHRDKCLNLEALAMLLRRLVYPNRLSEIRKQFGRSEPACCRIILHTGK